MIISKLLALIKKWQTEELQILQKKANDYANGNVFSNFEKTAVMCDVKPEKVFQMLLGIKLCRMVELSSGKEAKNESQTDTLLDMANYAKLYRAYLEKDNG